MRVTRFARVSVTKIVPTMIRMFLDSHPYQLPDQFGHVNLVLDVKHPELCQNMFPRGLSSSCSSTVCGCTISVFLWDLLHEEKEPIEWRSLRVGAERGVSIVNTCSPW